MLWRKWLAVCACSDGGPDLMCGEQSGGRSTLGTEIKHIQIQPNSGNIFKITFYWNIPMAQLFKIFDARIYLYELEDRDQFCVKSWLKVVLTTNLWSFASDSEKTRRENWVD